MENRRLDITVVSANDLKYVNIFSKMDVYVVVSIIGDPRSNQITPVHRNGGTRPSWNSPMRFTFNEAAAKLNQLILSLRLRCERLLGDKDIGEVYVAINDLLHRAGGSNGMLSVTLPVNRPSGRHQGELTFSYEFGDQSVSPSAPEPQAPDLSDTPVAPVRGAPDVQNPPPPPVAVPSAPMWGYPPPPPPPPPPFINNPAPQPRREYSLQPFVQATHLALMAAGLFCGPSAGAGDYGSDGDFSGLFGV